MDIRLRDFWMVLRDGSSHTSYRHGSFQSAKIEAARLARQCPGTRFFVLRCVGAAEYEEPVRWFVPLPDDDMQDDEVPF